MPTKPLTAGELRYLARLANLHTHLPPRFYKDDRSDEEAFARRLERRCRHLAVELEREGA